MFKLKTTIARRFLLCITLASLILLSFPITAYAGGPPFIMAGPLNKQTSSGVDLNPCTGDLGISTSTFRGVFQYMEFPDGTIHFTLVQNGTYEFEPYDSSKPSYVGREAFSTKDIFNDLNERMMVTNNTIVAKGSDGSSLRYHMTNLYKISDGNVELIKTDVRCG